MVIFVSGVYVACIVVFKGLCDELEERIAARQETAGKLVAAFVNS